MRAAENQEGEESVEAQLIKGAFSSLTLYRWEKIKGAMPKFTGPTNVMLIHDNNYIGVSVPDRLYYSTALDKGLALSSIEDGFHFGGFSSDAYHGLPAGDKEYGDMPKNLAGYSSGWKDDVHFKDYCTDYLLLNDRAVNYSKKDSMIKTDRDVFYTNDNRDTPYLKYTNVYQKGEYDFFFIKDY